MPQKELKKELKIITKNFIGGLLLCVVTLLGYEYHWGAWIILASFPGWILLFNWNN